MRMPSSLLADDHLASSEVVLQTDARVRFMKLGQAAQDDCAVRRAILKVRKSGGRTGQLIASATLRGVCVRMRQRQQRSLSSRLSSLI